MSNNDHVLIVVQINNTTGDTTFLRSYISGDPFTKIEETSGKFKGFNIPATAVYKNIDDTCQSSGLSKDCITITDDDDFPKLSDYQTQKYGFIVTTTASQETIYMYSLDVTGEQLITSDEKEIRTIANIALYERTKITTASDGAVAGVLDFFAPSAASSAASSSKPKTYLKTTDKVWIRKAMDNMADGMEVNKDKVYEYKETKKDTTGTTFYHVYDKGAEVGWLPEALDDKKYMEVISAEDADLLNPSFVPPISDGRSRIPPYIPVPNSKPLISDKPAPPPGSGNPNKVLTGYIKITEYNGLYQYSPAFDGIGTMADIFDYDQNAYNKGSMIYKFNDYKELNDRDNTNIYQVDVPNSPDSSKKYWLKENYFTDGENRVIASVISEEEAKRLIEAEKLALQQPPDPAQGKSEPPPQANVDHSFMPQTGKLRLLSGEPTLGIMGNNSISTSVSHTSMYNKNEVVDYTGYFKDNRGDEWFHITEKNGRDGWIKGWDLDSRSGKKRPLVEIMNLTLAPDASANAQSASPSTSAKNVREFNKEIARLLGKPDLSSAIKAVGDAAAAAATAIGAMKAVKEEPNALSAAIKAVGVAAAAAATAIGAMKAKPSGDLASVASAAASDLASNALDSLISVFAPDNKSELSEAASAVAKAAGDAATEVGKLSAPMAEKESDEEEERRRELALVALAKIDELREKNKKNIPDSESLAEEVKKNVNQTIKYISKIVSDYDSLIESAKTAKTLDDLTKATEKNKTNKTYLNMIADDNDGKLANINDDAIVKLYEETINNARSKLEKFTEVSNTKLAELQAKVASEKAESEKAESELIERVASEKAAAEVAAEAQKRSDAEREAARVASANADEEERESAGKVESERLEKVAAEEKAEAERLERVAADEKAEAERLEKVAADEKAEAERLAKVADVKEEPEQKLAQPLLAPDDNFNLETLSANGNITAIGQKTNVNVSTQFNEEVRKILNEAGIEGGGVKIGDNKTLIEKANKFIDNFKKSAYELLKRPVFLKLTSLDVDQLSKLFLNTEIIIPNDDKAVASEYYTESSKKKLLLSIIKFFYVDLTFLVVFNVDMQTLLLDSGFDEYCYTETINDNRNNYINLSGRVGNSIVSNIYENENMSRFIDTKNKTINEDSREKERTKRYTYIPTTEPAKSYDKYKVRIGELTVYIKGFLKIISSFKNKIEQKMTDTDTDMEELEIGTYDVYNILIPIVNNKKKQLEVLKTTLISVIEANDKTIIKYLNEAISENSKKNIITYLKLRNDDNSTSLYNERFNIHTNKTDKSIIVKYLNDNFKFYDQKMKSTDKYTISSNLIGAGKNFAPANQKVNVKNYDFQYAFGKFTDLFLPEMDNEMVARSMSTIKTKIKGILNDANNTYTTPPVPVFMLGYGASGAGKTSSLIYFNKGSKQKEKDGILVHLCNQLSDTYASIEICSTEFYHVNSKDSESALDKPILNQSPIVPEDSEKRPTIRFIYKEGFGFVLDADYVHKNHHQYRVLTERNGDTINKYVVVCNDEPKSTKYYKYEDSKSNQDYYLQKDPITTEPKNALIMVHKFLKGTSLGKVAIHLIDTDRFVKATTNNPNSSRSHTLIFVKLKNKTPELQDGNIIIGDFAGVENAFACEDPSTIGNFLKVLRDNPDPTKRKSYYSTEVLGANPDPFGKLELPIVEQQIKLQSVRMAGGVLSKTCEKMIAIPDPVYNFDAPDVRISWDKLDKSVTEYCKKNTDTFAWVIYTIRKYLKVLDQKVLTEDIINKLYNTTEINKFIEEFEYYSGDQTTKDKKKLQATNEAKTLTALKNEVEAVIKSIDNSVTRLLGYNDIYEKPAENQMVNLNQLYADCNKEGRIDSVSALNSNTTGKKCVGLVKTASAYRTKIMSDLKSINTQLQNIQDKFTSPNGKKYINNANINIPTIANSKITFNPNTNFKETLDSAADALAESANKIITYINTKLLDILKENLSQVEKMLGNIDEYFNAIMYKFDTIIGSDKYKEPRDLAKTIHTNIMKKPNGEALINYIRDVEIEKVCREGNSGVICENRREEGYFINDSLSKVRDVISKILHEKNKTSISISPDFIDDCLEKYCYTNEGCFGFDETNVDSERESLSETGSVIFDEIYKVLNETQKYQAIEELYKDIIVSVFCVFNISRTANNPPPTPYMDINNLKHAFFSGLNSDNYSDFNSFSKEIIRMIKEKCESPNFEPKDGFNDKVGDLMKIRSKQRTVLDNSVENTIFNEFENITSVNIDYDTFMENYKQDMLKSRIREFIDMIDNSNAVSAIGTLEFLDNISKYNTVRTICNGPLAINKEYKELYKEDILGGKSRITKRRKRKHKTTTLKSYSRR